MVTQEGWYRLKNPESDVDALAGAYYDLWVTEDMLSHCLDTSDPVHQACEELEEGCWTAAIVRYERAFNGLPKRLSSLVLSHLSPSQMESHHFFRFLRDKMFAHRTGVGDDFQARGAVFPQPDGNLCLVNVAPRASRISSLGTDMASEFHALVVVARSIVTPLLELSKAEATKRLQASPLDDVVRGGPLPKPDLTPKKSDPDFQRYLARALK